MTDLPLRYLVLNAVLDWAKKKQLRPGQVASELGVTHARWTNWKSRGVPPAEHKRVADRIGRTIDDIYRNVHIDDSSERLLIDAETVTLPDKRLTGINEMWPKIDDDWRDQVFDTAARGYKIKNGRPSQEKGNGSRKRRPKAR